MSHNTVTRIQGEIPRESKWTREQCDLFGRASKLAKQGCVAEARAMLAHDEPLVACFDRQQRSRDGRQRERDRMHSERREAHAPPAASPSLPKSSRLWPK